MMYNDFCHTLKMVLEKGAERCYIGNGILENIERNKFISFKEAIQ